MTDITSKFYKVSSPRIIHETIGNDTLVINLEVGHYFSLSSTASKIWTLLIEGLSTEQIASLISDWSARERAAISADLDRFLTELEREGLVIEAKANAATEVCKYTTDNEFVYSVPSIERFTDLEALLLADPVHEFVDD